MPRRTEKKALFWRITVWSAKGDDDERYKELLTAADTPILLKFCSQLYDLNIRYRFLAGSTLNDQRCDVKDEHAGILAAAIAWNADVASERLLNHYRVTGAFLSGLLGDKNLVRLQVRLSEVKIPFFEV